MSDIQNIVFKTVADTAKVEISAISGETRLTEDLKLKSVDKISISAVLSSQLGVSISMFDILKVKSVAELIALAESKVKK